jgi:hypothetical protein
VSLSVVQVDAVARLEASGDTSGADGSDGPAEGDSDTMEWQDALFVDRERDRVVGKNDDLVSESCEVNGGLRLATTVNRRETFMGCLYPESTGLTQLSFTQS